MVHVVRRARWWHGGTAVSFTRVNLQQLYSNNPNFSDFLKLLRLRSVSAEHLQIFKAERTGQVA